MGSATWPRKALRHTCIMPRHGSVEHWKIYRILRENHPDALRRELRLLSTVLREFGLDPSSEADINTAIAYLDRMAEKKVELSNNVEL